MNNDYAVYFATGMPKIESRDFQLLFIQIPCPKKNLNLFSAGLIKLIEQEAGIVSTFFILTTCESYNVLCDRNRNLLRELVAMGHEIGLHFDPRLYRDELDPAVRREVELLSFAADQAVRSISLHNPRSRQCDFRFTVAIDFTGIED